MKQKLLTLMIALMVMTMGAQKVFAEPTENLVLTVQTGTPYAEESELSKLIGVLFLCDQLQIHKNKAGKYVCSSMAGKELFIITETRGFQLFPDVTEADDICYTFTDADREMLKEENTLYTFIQPYKTVTMHFVGNQTDCLVATLKSGMSIDEKEGSQALMDIEFVIEILASTDQIKIENDNENNMTYFLSKDGKKLFYLGDDERIIIAPGVTSEDDITYILTDENMEFIMNVDDELYEYIQPYKALQLHFEIPEDFVAKLVTGMNLTTEINQGIYKSIVLMLYYFNQLKADYDFEKGETVVSSLNDKVLLTMTDDGVITLAPDVTVDDNINYTITQEDLDKLADADKDLYNFAASYKTIQLLFAENLVVTIKERLHYDDEDDVFYAIELMCLCNQLQFSEDTHSFTSMEGKPLFAILENVSNHFYIYPDVTEADDLSYTITEEDLQKLKEKGYEYYKFFLQYKTVTIHFEVSQDKDEDLVVTIKEGLPYDDEDDVFYATGLMYLCNQLQFSEETYSYTSMEGKSLFTILDDGVYHIYPGVTEADDMSHTITEEDLQNLKEIGYDYYLFFLQYKTVTIHFEVSQGGNEDFVCTIKDGMEFNLEENIEAMAIYVLSLLQQLKIEDDTILSKEDKVLFYIINHYVTLAPGVTSADDINYTLTNADRLTLANIDAGLAGFFSGYNSVQLHFDVAIPGDMNGDGDFNLEDITWLIAAYLSSEAGADLDGDGKLTIDDITSLIEMYLQK